MRIIYDTVSDEYIYPLGKSDIGRLRQIVPNSILAQIRGIRMGCNTRTTQEGRIVQHGAIYDIRVNFCLREGSTAILSKNNAYLDQIKRYGGIINTKEGIVTWDLLNAKYYAYYILLHEIGHIVFTTDPSNSHFKGKSTKYEEEWCDKYASNKVQELLRVSDRT